MFCFAGAKLQRLFELTKFFDENFQKNVINAPFCALLGTKQHPFDENCVLSHRFSPGGVNHRHPSESKGEIY